jgi:thymidylate kinase
MSDEFKFSETRVEWDKRHASLLKDFLDTLTSKDIRYVILKNDDGLPFDNHSKDVDIVVEPGKYNEVKQIIQSCYKSHGVSYYRVHKFERLRCWYGMNPDTRFAIHIDLLEGFLHKGFEMFPFELMYSHAYKNRNGVYVLDNVFGNLVLLMHSTICYHKIKDKYASRIAQTYQSHRDELNQLIRGLLDTEAAGEMIRLLKKGDYKSIEAKGKWFSHKSKKHILCRRPLFTCINVVDFLWEKARRLILNSPEYNVLISVHAPDGTGKTTFIQSFTELLAFYFVNDANGLVKIYHHRPCMLPNLGAAGEKAKVMKQDTDFTRPHRAKPAGFFSSLIRMTYYWLDYVLCMPLILRRNAQFNNITVFDRYIYDFLVDPFRTRIKLPYSIRRFFTRLVKQPKVVYVLDTDVDTIYHRKQELTREEIARQLVEFRRLSDLGESVHLLDASKTPDAIANDAIRVFMNAFATKL